MRARLRRHEIARQTGGTRPYSKANAVGQLFQIDSDATKQSSRRLNSRVETTASLSPNLRLTTIERVFPKMDT